MKPLTKDDFRQTDSKWEYAYGQLHLVISPNDDGTFSLHISWSTDPIPPATQYPTEPEWGTTIALSNMARDYYIISLDKEKG